MTLKAKMMCLPLLGIVAVAAVAEAAPIAYDGINYPPGALNANGPAFGFAAPWLAEPGVVVVAGGLASPFDLPPTGGGVSGSFNFQAPLTNTLAPLPGKEFWASFLIYQGALNDQTFMGLSPAGSPFGAPPAVAFGIQLGHYGIFVGGVFTPTPFAPTGSPDLLVAHFIANGATWTMELYVNPPGFPSPPVLVMNVAPITYGNVVNQNQAGYETDEFRLGDTSGDVSAAGATPTVQTTWGRIKSLYR
jgi:hypothetical protein